MKLAINSGSSTLKFKLFSKTEEVLVSGIFKNYDSSSFKFESGNLSYDISKDEWEKRVEYLLNFLKSENFILDLSQIEFIVHRVVHGGEKFVEPTLVNSEVLNELDLLTDLAPLHNPFSLKIIRDFFEIDPNLKLYAVFDTAFHSTMPEFAYLYGLPLEYYKRYKVRRYGFHGISHKFVALEASKLLNNQNPNLITCHLGSGCSITAIIHGKSVDNSMGFTPEENLIMATRAGDTDFSAINFIQTKENLSDDQMEEILNKKSGLLGISGYSKDMKVLLEDYDSKGSAKLAIDMFIYSIIKQIGAYFAVLKNVDALVFTGGIGEGSDVIRKMICESFVNFGVEIDDNKNLGEIDVKENLEISRTNSKVKIFVVPTNEELQMVREVSTLVDT